MKKSSLAILFVLIMFQTKAQEVISSGGDYNENATISISWTLGEPVIETVSNTSNVLTQGFQQTKLTVSEIFEINSKNISISLFPNPTQDFVNLEVDNYNNLTFQLFSFNGKLIQTNKLSSKNTEIKMTNLSAATYFLKILNNNKLIKTYKIIKQ